MNQRKNILIQAGLCSCLIFAIGIAIQQCRSHRNTPNPTPFLKTDTIFIHDTTFVKSPIPSQSKDIDTIQLPAQIIIQKDTVLKLDTIYISLPIEQKYYSSKNYEAWISGYKPKLDSLRIFGQETQLISQIQIPEKRKNNRWGIGIQVGYGMKIHQQPEFYPYIGIGISYNLFSF